MAVIGESIELTNTVYGGAVFDAGRIVQAFISTTKKLRLLGNSRCREN
jgi:hypothetical protein